MKKPKDIKSNYTLPLKCESSYLKSDQHVFITSAGGIFCLIYMYFLTFVLQNKMLGRTARIFARSAHFLQVSVHFFFFPGRIFSLEIMFDVFSLVSSYYFASVRIPT